MSKQNEEFKPYVPADKILPEFTVTSILLGVILAVVFGAANAYLGLRVGLTVSASIPAAVISMGVIRVILRRDSILENNIVQTIGSAGESLAAGAIFTMPALFLWAKEWGTKAPSLLEIFLIALVGGVLGGSGSKAYQEMSKKVFSECNRDIQDYFGVNSRNNIPRLRFEEAMDYVKCWEPCNNTKLEIRNSNLQIGITQ